MNRYEMAKELQMKEERIAAWEHDMATDYLQGSYGSNFEDNMIEYWDMNEDAKIWGEKMITLDNLYKYNIDLSEKISEDKI